MEAYIYWVLFLPGSWPYVFNLDSCRYESKLWDFFFHVWFVLGLRTPSYYGLCSLGLAARCLHLLLCEARDY